MYHALVRNTRFQALSGVAAIAFGVLVLVWPNLTFVALVALFGVFAFIVGAFALAAGLSLLADRQTTWVPYVIGGLAGIAIGAVVFLRPGIAALTRSTSLPSGPSSPVSSRSSLPSSSTETGRSAWPGLSRLRSAFWWPSIRALVRWPSSGSSGYTPSSMGFSASTLPIA